jgi:hypothetical protein
MSCASYYFDVPIWQFAANRFGDLCEFAVVFAYDAKDWNLDRLKKFVHWRLDS